MPPLVSSLAHALPQLAHSASPVDKIAYARDLWPRHHLAVSQGRIAEHQPGLIVWPSSTDEVASVVRHCADEGLPLVPFGAGSGVCGGIMPNQHMIVMDLKRMSRWRVLNRDEPSLEVEAGALGIRLEEELNAQGFTLGHFPSSILCSTVGGWVATRSAGQCSSLYGKIEDMVASLECVVDHGDIVRFHRRVHGPDLTPLFIGSEGVLGVVTAAKLRLHPVPANRTFAAFSFPTLQHGWSAMRDMFQAGLRPAVARLYDPFDSFLAKSRKRGKRRKPTASDTHNKQRSSPTYLGEGSTGWLLRNLVRNPRLINELIDRMGSYVFDGSTLILIFEGPDQDTADDLQRATNMAIQAGGRSLGEEPARHWLKRRYSISYRQSPVLMAGAFTDTMEVAASWSHLEQLYDAVHKTIGRHAFVMAHLSHAYPDGCSIYFTFVGSASAPEAAESKYDSIWQAALDAAIGAGGTLSHHHGVGRSKAPKLGAELGLGVQVIHSLRHALDPAGIMNPGNLLPRETPKAQSTTSVTTEPVSPPATPVLDRDSLLVHASGTTTLAEIEALLTRERLTLALDEAAPRDTTVDAWIAAGAVGAPDPWADPVDHLVAGFTARLNSGAELRVRPAPRRAVGPDLFALFIGMQGRVGTITSAYLRVHKASPPGRPRALHTTIARDPALTERESAWIDAVAKAVKEPLVGP